MIMESVNPFLPKPNWLRNEISAKLDKYTILKPLLKECHADGKILLEVYACILPICESNNKFGGIHKYTPHSQVCKSILYSAIWTDLYVLLSTESPRVGWRFGSIKLIQTQVKNMHGSGRNKFWKIPSSFLVSHEEHLKVCR